MAGFEERGREESRALGFSYNRSAEYDLCIDAEGRRIRPEKRGSGRGRGYNLCMDAEGKENQI